MKEQTLYVTSPIYYVNGDPHVGHAHTSVMCDILKRSAQMRGRDCFYTTGVDEHGQKNQQCIEQSGLSAQEFLDKASKNFSNLFDRLNVLYDYFVRTTKDHHVAAVKEILSDLHERGILFKKEYEGLYCVGCEQFKTESDLNEDGCCPDHLTKPIETKEANYFLNLSEHQEWLVDFIKSNPDWIQPEAYQKEVLNMLSEPLPDLCISRPKERVWHGIELPFDKDYVTYIWFDALINYISNIGFPNDMQNFREKWPGATHVMGKDIIKTHCIYWPIMLKSLGIEPQHKNLVHGYWVGEGGVKMSKSLGNVVNPNDVIDTYGADTLRFYMAKSMGRSEAQISDHLVQDAYSKDLGNNIGNLYSRTLALLKKNFGDTVPEVTSFSDFETSLLQEMATAAEESLPQSFELGEISNQARTVLELGRKLNLFFDQEKPWVLAKDPEKRDELAACSVSALEGLRIIYELAYPIMPETANKALAGIGVPEISPETLKEQEEKHKFVPFAMKAGMKLGDQGPLFPRLETKK